MNEIVVTVRNRRTGQERKVIGRPFEVVPLEAGEKIVGSRVYNPEDFEDAVDLAGERPQADREPDHGPAAEEPD